MRKIGDIKITEIQYGVLKKMLIEFSNENSECCDAGCPFNIFDEKGDNDWPKEIDDINGELRHEQFGRCICNIFEEFQMAKGHNCPCHIYGEDAFRRLAIVVKKMKDPNAYKI